MNYFELDNYAQIDTKGILVAHLDISTIQKYGGEQWSEKQKKKLFHDGSSFSMSSVNG